tara:strand:+ start:600 stop:950 length:351 start_codon:yes stop_codon:yes gene_type:complete
MDVNDVSVSRTDINQTLNKIRSLASQTKAIRPDVPSAVQKPEFHSLITAAKDAIGQVNSSQLQSESVKNAFLSGDKNVSISQVMMASVQSKVAFEGLTAVRNKMIDFYKEVMNMPV